MNARILTFFLLLVTLLPASLKAYPLALPLTLHDLGAFLKINFKFVEDQHQFGQEDYWQSPQEFLSRQAGDCEDFALLAQYLLSQIGKDSYVISLYGDNYAHTIAVFQDDEGRFNVVNQDKVRFYRAETIEEALSKVHSDWTWAGIAELRNTRGWMVRKIKRSR